VERDRAGMRRRIIQFLAMLGINGYYPGYLNSAIYQGSFKQFCTPVLNCYACPGAVMACPVGALQHFVIINQNPAYYIFGSFAIAGMLVGRMACGWLCPFGFVQDLLYKVRSVKLSIPRWVTHFKYVTLVGLVFLITYIFQEPWFSKLCPDGLLIGGIPFTLLSEDIRGQIKEMFWIKLGILIVVFSLAVTTKRPFCRTVCPAGTIYSYFNNASFWQMTVDDGCCTRCNRCQKVCPMDIRVWENAQSVDCIRCLECTRCPCVSYRPFFGAAPAAAPALPAGVPGGA
jgi:ferredoxin-type protein NapH